VSVTVVSDATAAQVTGAHGTLQFYFVQLPTVTSVSPTSGCVDGGEVITVTGTGFDAKSVEFGATVTCEFGEVSVPGELRGDGRLSCASPPAAAARTVDFTVRVNGDSANGGTVFRYTERMVVTGCMPT